MTETKGHRIPGLVGWLVACYATAAIGAVASVEAQGSYGQLVQPPWAPPPWLFGPVWSVLYGMMAAAAWLVWREGGFRAHGVTLGLFVAHLMPNALWSWLFFAWSEGALALADIALLWALVVVTLVSFWRVRAIAGVLLVPYLLWVTFASALNHALWRLNPEVLG